MASGSCKLGSRQVIYLSEIMAKYSSKAVAVAMPANDIYNRISHMSALQQRLEQLPQEQLAMIGEVKFTDDSVTINAPQVGEIRFDIVDRQEPSRIVFGAANMPVPMSLAVDLESVADDCTEVTSTIDVEIPVMLRPLVGGKMQEAADRFTDLIAQLNS